MEHTVAPSISEKLEYVSFTTPLGSIMATPLPLATLAESGDRLWTNKLTAKLSGDEGGSVGVAWNKTMQH